MRRLLLLTAALLLAGCDGGPQGPGTLVARVVAPELGAAVVELTGAGIQGFTARGSTRLYSAEVPGRTGVYRVVVVDPIGGDIGFEIQVDDVVGEGPVAVVTAAADTGDRPLPAGSVTVRIER